ncbi:hypothetical protein QAD02_003798 [Eretmocerus hayati]|uniref:Uncharacterized protein n=1 Tax=Eretmocerus hayati TaxID=131215 RepID=A0ACC2NN67_9HYME|nr:hypothetical protein QAD02_003798 [Eretmocerus hayati]
MIRILILSTALVAFACDKISNFGGDSVKSRTNLFEEETAMRDSEIDLVAAESGFINSYYDAAASKIGHKTILEELPDQLYVVKGDEVQTSDYPFVVSLQSANFKHCCGGSIIAPYLILTAAHCLWLAKCHITQVQVPSDEVPLSRNYQIMYRIPHPKYDNEMHVNDIALLVLNRRVTKGQTVDLLGKNWRVKPGSVSYALGWGKTEFRFESKELRRADLPVIPESNCWKYYKTPGFWICTDSRYKDVCHGDSGGPLMVERYQVGVISMGKGCLSGMPTVFTNVGAYRKWIDKYVAYYDRQT